MTSTVTATSATFDMALPDTLQVTDDYGCFIYVRPNAVSGPVATCLHLSPTIMASFDAWLNTQTVSTPGANPGDPDVITPKYPNLGNLVMRNALQTLLPAALAAHPPSELITAGGAISRRNSHCSPLRLMLWAEFLQRSKLSSL